MKKAWKILLFFGLVSLLADVTYEGARSIIPSYLYYLGASASLTGLILGVSEMIAYIMRLPAGHIADKWRNYWSLTITGYIINLFAVPLLALANSWQIALLLLIIERFGKAIRTPPREVLLGGLKKEIPTGKIFGFHEFMDQLGAMIGPLIATVVLFYRSGDYKTALIFFAIPASLSLLSLLLAYENYDEKYLEGDPSDYSEDNGELSRKYWFYLLATFFAIGGLIHFSIVLYAAEKEAMFQDWFIPIIYFLIMGVDGLTAIFAGLLYEKFGILINALIPISAVLSAFLFLVHTQQSFIALAVTLGVAIGTFESVTRGAITDIVKISKRGLGYGAFYTMIGIAMTISGYAFGYLYENTAYMLILLISATMETVAIALYTVTAKI